MPKLKTHKGAKRRFHMTGSGKIMRRKGNISHLRRRKATRASGEMSEMLPVHRSAVKRLRRLLPYGTR
ncbi:MAG: 50S ribosomal protein L35 [Dehalococcoidia bacterium]|nr:50S ribosomal protein L35 [Dehalococcoidia bacterium]